MATSAFCSFVRAIFLWLIVGVAVLTSDDSRAGTFTNAIISDGADPWVVYQNGYYYFSDTTGGAAKVHRATSLAGTNGIGKASVLWTFTPPAPYNKEVWAPELHVL